ncbi:MAG: DUF998 domain-containing protein [Candidatus Thorarchaeota archaeon]|nr:DUF998 domain-containing protein [Candidatus Thorarchaeota archaeon]
MKSVSMHFKPFIVFAALEHSTYVSKHRACVYLSMSFLKNLRGFPRAILMGFVAPIIAIGCILAAIGLSPNFDWVTNALSDLGHYTRTDIGPNPLLRAVIFNSGLIIAGILLFIVILILIKRLNDLLTQIAFLPFALASAFVAAIGIFSENFGAIHFYVSVGFFASFPFAMWFVGLSWLRFPGLRWFSVVSLLLPFFSVYIWRGTFNGSVPWMGMAIPEILTALTAILWVWALLWLEAEGSLDVLFPSVE